MQWYFQMKWCKYSWALQYVFELESVELDSFANSNSKGSQENLCGLQQILSFLGVLQRE